MRPTFRQLQYLVAVADTGRFHEAARLMNVSQPSLSAQIADAENQLGVVLLERGRNGAILTPAGEEIVRRARVILTQMEDLKAVAHQSKGALAGRYRLGTVPTIGPYFLPSAVKELHRLYPELLMSVREERTIDLEEKLNDGRLDMIISTPEDHVHAKSMPLFEETLYVCAAQDDVLSTGSGPVSLKELKGRELLSLGHGHRLSVTIQKLADAAGAHVSAEYEGTSLDAVRQMSAMGAGVAVLPNLYAILEAQRDPTQIVRPIQHTFASRPISLLWRAGSPLGTAIEELGGVLRSVAKTLLENKARAPRRS